MNSKVNIVSQKRTNTAIVAVVKVNNNGGSIGAACEYLTEMMHEDSVDLGDKVYGNIWASTVSDDYEWTSKTLAYYVKVEKSSEETVLTLMRKQYTYEL